MHPLSPQCRHQKTSANLISSHSCPKPRDLSAMSCRKFSSCRKFGSHRQSWRSGIKSAPHRTSHVPTHLVPTQHDNHTSGLQLRRALENLFSMSKRTPAPEIRAQRIARCGYPWSRESGVRRDTSLKRGDSWCVSEHNPPRGVQEMVSVLNVPMHEPHATVCRACVWS